METLYIVKRPFKTDGTLYLLGSIIVDPNEIRLFRSKVREGKIIEVKKEDLPRMAEYVESRTGVNPLSTFKEYLDNEKAKDEAEAKRIADDEEAKRLADEEEAKRIADEEEAKRLADEAEVKRLADEAEAKRLADEKAKEIKTPQKAATVVIKG